MAPFGLPLLAIVVGFRFGAAAGLVVLAVGVIGQLLYVRWFPHISRAMGYGSVTDTPAAGVPTGGTVPDVTLYTANVCPFCPIIRRRLAELQQQSSFQLREIDVTFDRTSFGPRDCAAFLASARKAGN